MKNNDLNLKVATAWRLRLLLFLGALSCFPGAGIAGTWTPLVNQAPGNVQLMLLLTDGTVLAADSGAGTTVSNAWYKLTPDAKGSYVKGTWSTLKTMADSRLYYTSCVLRDGRVFVAGGEYGTGGARAEVYNPQTDVWSSVNVPTSLLDPTKVSPLFVSKTQTFDDSGGILLPDGRVMIAPVAPNRAGGTLIYDPVANTFANGPAVGPLNQNEASWVKLPDNSILTVDASLTSSERYLPASNTWVNDAPVPAPLYGTVGGEIGPAFLLPDGTAFFLGANGNSAIYTPTGNATNGSWAPGPGLPNVIQYPLDNNGNEVPGSAFTTLGVPPDAAGAMLVNGRILYALSGQLYNDARVGTTPAGATNNYWSTKAKNPLYPAPTTFFVYDPVAQQFAPITGPTGATDDVAAYQTMMLDLPDGSVLYAHQGTDLYVYSLDPVNNAADQPLAAGKPTIGSISMNPDGSFHLTGTGLNGISQGAAYGDDAQMDTNYPIVRLTAATGEVTYARTFNWSSTGVQTGNQVVSTDYVLPAVIGGGGTVSLAVVANGISSDPVLRAIVNPTETLTFSGASSAGISTFDVKGGTTVVQHAVGSVPSIILRTVGGKLQFLNTATAATSTIAIGGGPGNGGSGGAADFHDQSTAGSATIVNASGESGPNFDELNPNPVSGFGAQTRFYDTSLAGTAHITNNGEYLRGGSGGLTTFYNSASAEHGVFTSNPASADLGLGGATQFTDTATAGFGTFLNVGAKVVSDLSGGQTIFFLSSNAGHGTFTNQGATAAVSALTNLAAAGATRFRDSSSAANGTFINEGTGYQVARGVTQFFGTATAGNGTFINKTGTYGGGAVEFYGFSTAGDGTFTNDSPGSVYAGGGEFSFRDDSKAGNGHFTNTGAYGGYITFNDRASADHATIMLEPNQINNRLDFKGNSTAGNSVIQICAGAVAIFQGNATAANAAITIGANAPGSLVSSGQGQVGFYGGTAGDAQIAVMGAEISNTFGSALVFYNAESTAGNATITVNGAKNGGITGGRATFDTSSHAGNATLIANGDPAADVNTAGTIAFRGGAQGELCRVVANVGGMVDFSANGIYGGTAVGSIEGAGTIMIGASLLTVGSLNTDTVVLGPLTYGGASAGLGGRLTKSGTGTLTLAGANTYTGLTTINAGALAVNGSLAGGVQVNAGAALKGTGTISGTVTVAPGGIVAPGNSPGTLTCGKLVLDNASILSFELGTVSDQVVVNGDVILDGVLNITAAAGGLGSGVYDLFQWTGNLTNNGITIGSVPVGFSASDFALQVINGKLRLSVGGALAVTVTPAVQAAAVGTAATFTAVVPGATALTYQWQRYGVNIPGATGGSYTILPVARSDAGEYRVVVTSDAGTATSNVAILAVLHTATEAAVASDFNGDGRPDLIWSNSKTGERALWLMNGANFLAASTLGNFPLEWTIAATGDFNGDGKPDIVWSNSQTGERALWLMDGTNLLAVSTLGIFPLEWTIAATGDFNGDGKPDIVWSNSSTGERALWLMDGTTRIGVSTLGIFPLEWTVAATGDFNGDGKPDLVWSNDITGERALWLMDGTTRIGVSTLGIFPLEWTVAGTADFNGDGKPDIIWSNSVTGERALWLMDGTQFIAASTLGIFPLEWTVSN